MASNQHLRERMERIFRRRLLVETFRQPDGSPLLELWRAEEPLPRLQLPPSPEDHETAEGEESER